MTIIQEFEKETNDLIERAESYSQLLGRANLLYSQKVVTGEFFEKIAETLEGLVNKIKQYDSALESSCDKLSDWDEFDRISPENWKGILLELFKN